MTLTAQDDGKRMAHPANEPLEISLPENPTTGFRWSFEELYRAEGNEVLAVRHLEDTRRFLEAQFN